MRKILVTYIHASMLLAFLAMVLFTLGGCGGDGGGSISGMNPSPAPSEKSVVITGTVPGTVAIAYDFATGMEVSRNVASGTPKTFTLNVAPGTYYLMFLANEGTPTQGIYPFYNVTGGNVFTFEPNTTYDLGVLVFNGYPRTATPQFDPISGHENVTETFVHEASFSPGDGKWTATRTFVNSTCSGHYPGATVTENVTIAQGYGLVTYTPAGSNETAIGHANVNTAILTASNGALETIYLTMQPDGSLAGSFSRVGYGCSEEGTITAVLGTSPPPAVTLAGLSISGPSSMNETGTATYTATANWSNGSTTSVTPVWSVNPHVAEITAAGVLSCSGGVAGNQTVTITATYSSGGITKTATRNVTITHAPSTYIPFTTQELSGKVFFQEHSEGGGYSSFLYILNDDSSLDLYVTFALPRGDTSHNVSGTWSNDPDGLFLDFRFADFLPYTVERISDSFTEMEVAVHTMVWGNPVVYYETWEKTVPVDAAKLPGTYTDDIDGTTWVFNANGTGTVSVFGGVPFTWSVDANGVLRMVASNGYAMSFYVRASSQSTATEYTILKAAFTETQPAGGFYAYYGGIELTPQ